MGGNWFRVNSLYKIDNPQNVPNASRVEFYNRSLGVLITSISIVHYHNRQLTIINLNPSPFNYQKVVLLAQDFFKEIILHKNTFSCFINFKPTSNLHSFINFFLACKNISDKEDYRDIISELTQLAFILTRSSTQYSYLRGNHFISEDLPWRDYVNPEKSDSTQLIELIRKSNSSEQSNKEILRELMHGSPLDQHHLHSAIFKENNDILELLLVYCQNKQILAVYYPFPRYETVFDTARRLGDKEKLHILSTFYFPPQRLFPQRNTQITISHISSEGNDQRIISRITCNIDRSQKTLITIMKRTKQLTPHEKTALWKLFLACFPSVIHTKRERLFNQELANSNTFLELIFDDEGIIGCNIFQVSPHSKDEDIVIFAIRLAMLHPNYHQYRLMSLLSFRPLFSLQLALDKKIIGHFVALNEHSFKTIARSLFYPKYQDLHGYWDALRKEVVEKMNYPWCYHEDTVCYVPDELGFKKETNSGDLHTKFFYRYILGGSGEKAGFILFPVGKNSFEIIKSNLSNQLDFTTHIKEFSATLLSFIEANFFITSRKKKIGPCLADSRELFWNNKTLAQKIPINSTTTSTTKTCRL